MDIKKLLHNVLFLVALHVTVHAQSKGPASVGPLPSPNQFAWQQMEYYAFVHLSVNTYTDMAWGNGNEDPGIFNPTRLDCMQWARIAREAGMKGIILTAKHHSGFCLWPSEYTNYSVKNCPWKNGKGDIVREMSNACKAYGLKLGIYLSPWDRNRADYGQPSYITYFRNQLRELLTNYGDIFEIWFDGANGGSGYYGGANETRKIDRTTYYDWDSTYKLVRALQPKIVIWNDGGKRADLRWVGTESGYIGETNWSLLDSTGDVPEDMLRHGLENGNKWVPGEVNTSIRPEWFYHQREDSKVKALPQLMQTYYNSIGRNAPLLLNFPIMPDGLINQKDEKIVLEFGRAIKEAFAVNLAKGATAIASGVRANNPQFGAGKAIDQHAETYWAMDDTATTGTLTINFKRAVTFNRFLVQEYIQLGQRVKSFTIAAMVNGHWKILDQQTTIGYKRILCFPAVHATKFRLTITDAKACPLIANIGLFNAPTILAAPVIVRDRAGDVKIVGADNESQLYYTLDGTQPTKRSLRYTRKFKTADGKLRVRSIAYDQRTGRTSPVSEERFDIARKLWTVVGTTDSAAANIMDGDPATAWYQNSQSTMPVNLIIDLGKVEKIAGFRYMPDQSPWGSGIIKKYRFFVSMDGTTWLQADEGEFANIKNNPLVQTKSFALQKARYIRLQAMQTIGDDDKAGYAEVDIITQ